MKMDPIANQLRRDEITLHGLADDEQNQDIERPMPIAELGKSEDHREQTAGEPSQKGNKDQQPNQQAQHQSEIETKNGQPDRIIDTEQRTYGSLAANEPGQGLID